MLFELCTLINQQIISAVSGEFAMCLNLSDWGGRAAKCLMNRGRFGNGRRTHARYGERSYTNNVYPPFWFVSQYNKNNPVCVRYLRTGSNWDHHSQALNLINCASRITRQLQTESSLLTNMPPGRYQLIPQDPVRWLRFHWDSRPWTTDFQNQFQSSTCFPVLATWPVRTDA